MSFTEILTSVSTLADAERRRLLEHLLTLIEDTQDAQDIEARRDAETMPLSSGQALRDVLINELDLPLVEPDPLTAEEEAELGALADASRAEPGESIIFFPSEAARKAARAAIALQR